MSFLARTALRSATRSRGFATAANTSKFAQEQEALKHHAKETTELWRKVSYYACIPAVFVAAAWVYNAEQEHHQHLEHLKHENGGELPETPAYPYLNMRNKPFPWGMNSLFFNSHVQKDLSNSA